MTPKDSKVTYSVKRYSIDHFDEWNSFITVSKNGTFLFHRNFMEYHSDRFADFSLLLYDENRLIAVLPAHKHNDLVYSHNGLTYGGLIYTEKIKLREVISVFKSILQYLNDQGINKLFLKEIPLIYHRYPSDELMYALFIVNAKLVRRDSLSVINTDSAIPFTKTRRESIRRGAKNGLVIVEEPAFQLFWDKILIPNVSEKHGIQPVHTSAEMELLHQKFPNNIRHFNVYHNSKIVAGTTVFITDTVAHPQYISGNTDKNELGSLDFLYHYLITDLFANKKYFDFGISNEQQGRKLNEGLAFWKESFGARTIVQDFYEVETANFVLLDDVII